MSSFRIGQPTWAVNHPWNLPTKIQVFGGKWSYGKNVGDMFFWVWVTGYGIQSSLILSMLKPGKSLLLKHGNSLLGILCNRKNLKYNIQKDSPPEAFFACLNHGLTPTLHIEGILKVWSHKKRKKPHQQTLDETLSFYPDLLGWFQEGPHPIKTGSYLPRKKP